MRGIAGYMMILPALLLLAGCEKDELRPGPGERLPDGSFIDDPIVLARSEPVPLSRVEDGEYIIDLSEAPLVRYGSYNDLLISYWTTSSCDEDVYVLDVETGGWKQIGFRDDPEAGLGCRPSFAEQLHLLSSRSCDARQCVNDSAQIRLRGQIPAYYKDMIPHAEPIRLNPDFFTVAIPARYAPNFDGLAYGDGSLWTSNDFFNKIYNIAFTGEVLFEFEPPTGRPSGMASDGKNLWLADREGSIFKLGPDGEVLCSFSMEVNSVTGLAYGAEKLWLVDPGSGVPYYRARIYGLDPEASCRGGSAVVMDALEVPEGRPYGLAWDGSHLLVASDSLYKVTETGVLKGSYPLPVYGVRDIAWDGEGVWILNSGPRDFDAHDPVVTKFRLR